MKKELLPYREKIDSLLNIEKLTPPIPLEKLSSLADTIIEQEPKIKHLKSQLMVEINNLLWEPIVAKIPNDKKILLLPHCLKNSQKCKATIDSLGLWCQQCGACIIAEIQDYANKKGIATLVSESSEMISPLIETGEIQSVIGCSCLDSLEKAFPKMTERALPSIAIALNHAGCCDTSLDVDALFHALDLNDSTPYAPAPLLEIKETIYTLFKYNNPSNIIPNPFWSSGKHYRPLLTLLTYQALTRSHDISDEVKTLCCAIECFHKASLIHDDIEDNDSMRYDTPSLHIQFGIPIAINMGDLLIGVGYQKLTDLNINPKHIPLLLKIAADAHFDLSQGQHAEFTQSQPLFDIFKLKTAPAFRAAFLFGAVAADKYDDFVDVLTLYSDALGIAYQILDDIEDGNLNQEFKTQYFIYRNKVRNITELCHDVYLKQLLIHLLNSLLPHVL